MVRLLIALSVLSGNGSPEAAPDWQRLAGIVQYLQADYPDAVASGDRAALVGDALEAARALGAPAAPLVPKVQSLQSRIVKGEDPSGVSRDCAALVEEVVALGGLSRSPRETPDLERGRQLYAQACAACHGPTGNADTPVAAQLNPAPKKFQDAAVMDALSPYKAFNVVSLGVSGTPMPEFTTLSEADRWALAFYVFTLRQPPCEGQPPRAELDLLSRSTDAELSAKFGPEHLSCLRRTLPALDESRA